MTAILVPRMTMGDKSESSKIYKNVWKWQCFDLKFSEIWERLKITRGLYRSVMQKKMGSLTWKWTTARLAVQHSNLNDSADNHSIEYKYLPSKRAFVAQFSQGFLQKYLTHINITNLFLYEGVQINDSFFIIIKVYSPLDWSFVTNLVST